MRIGEVAKRTGVRASLIRYPSDRVSRLADRRRPGIDASNKPGPRVRWWLATAGSGGCDAIDDCPLLEGAPAPPAGLVEVSVDRGGVPA